MKRTRYRFQKISNSHLFFWKEKLSFTHQSLVASLSTLMEDWWISNFLKFNFTKREYDSTKKTFEHVSSFRLKKLIINPLLALFSHSCSKGFSPSFVQSQFMEKISLRKTSIVWLAFDEKKKKFRQKHFGLIFVWKRFRDWFKTSKPLPKNDAFPKRNDCNLCGKNNSFTKMRSCAA